MRLIKTIFAILATTMFLFTGFAPAQAASGADPLDDTPQLKQMIEHHMANKNPEPSREMSEQMAYPYVVEVLSVQRYTESTEILRSCSAPNGRCAIDRSFTVTASTSGGFGVSAGVVNADAGLGYSTSITTGVTCTSPVLGYNQIWAARPQGTFVIYDVHRYNHYGYLLGTERGTAFFPTGISCRVLYI